MPDDEPTMFTVTATATGEVRDADGHLLDAEGNRVPEDSGTVVTATQTMTVPAVMLARYTDDELRAAGLNGDSIAHIRRLTEKEQPHE
jgi:hypothetical protein